jgi:hypothetical protein
MNTKKDHKLWRWKTRSWRVTGTNMWWDKQVNGIPNNACYDFNHCIHIWSILSVSFCLLKDLIKLIPVEQWKYTVHLDRNQTLKTL